MQPTPATGNAATRRSLERNAGRLATAAVQRMEATHEWYRLLSARERSWVGVVAQAGIASFLTWYRDPDDAEGRLVEVFSAAPRELTRSISLRRTLDLVRTVIDEVESQVDRIAAPGDAEALRTAVLHYSREIAFAAAEVYAQAAETRGAWDARLEALVVDAVLRGEADDALHSRVSALGWEGVSSVAVVAGDAPPGSTAAVVDAVRAGAAQHGLEALVAVQGHRLIVVLGRVGDPLEAAGSLLGHWGPGPVVVGPVVPHLLAAGRSARAATRGHDAARAWPGAPRPCHADELLAERALAGDQHARRALVQRVHTPLAAAPSLLETATAYLAGGVLEQTARVLFVHPNTVRYRLRRVSDLIGYDLTDPHDAFCVRIALAMAALEQPRPWRRRTGDESAVPRGPQGGSGAGL